LKQISGKTREKTLIQANIIVLVATKKFMSIPTENYSKEMLELLDVYYETGIWRKYNWYDFLEELVRCDDAYKKNKKHVKN